MTSTPDQWISIALLERDPDTSKPGHFTGVVGSYSQGRAVSAQGPRAVAASGQGLGHRYGYQTAQQLSIAGVAQLIHDLLRHNIGDCNNAVLIVRSFVLPGRKVLQDPPVLQSHNLVHDIPVLGWIHSESLIVPLRLVTDMEVETTSE
ncbi:hypothetical protein J6590_070980 [Homalodisca vitripennis]|nr:hypothetical protein J6590_070980 [Homalodisca vitripennis]